MNMEEKEILIKVIEILTPYARNKEMLLEVCPETNILKDLQVNSSRLVDIVLAFEDVFNLTIEDEEADSIDTVGAAIELIKRKTA